MTVLYLEMLKSIHRIHQQFLNENKTGKYLKYAIGEIVLVVIEIFCLRLHSSRDRIKVS